MRIPKAFRLMGKLWTVKIVPVDKWNSEEMVGLCAPQTLDISIKAGLKPELQEHIFLHEVTHAILDAMGEEKLYQDETFIDTFAGLLHQALTSEPVERRHKKRR